MLSESTSSRFKAGFWLHCFALFVGLCTFALIAVGGLVTSKGVGMAVPDWPNSFGYNMFLFPASEWIGGILYEHSHRLIASFVGLLTVVLAIWIWVKETTGKVKTFGIIAFTLPLLLMGVRTFHVFIPLAILSVPAVIYGIARFTKNPAELRWLGWSAVFAVILQGAIGGFRVELKLDYLGIIHGTLAQLFFLLVLAIAVLTSQWWPASRDALKQIRIGTTFKTLTVVGMVLIFCQLLLGATMRHQHAGLAVPDFPLAHGKIWPDTDSDSIHRYNQQRMESTAINSITSFQIQLHMIHRILALLIAVIVAAVSWKVFSSKNLNRPLRQVAAIWSLLTAIQVGLGIFTVIKGKPADIATLHVLVGALIFAASGLTVVFAHQTQSFVSVATEKLASRTLTAALKS